LPVYFDSNKKQKNMKENKGQNKEIKIRGRAAPRLCRTGYKVKGLLFGFDSYKVNHRQAGKIQFRYGHNIQYGYDASDMKRWVIHETSRNDLAVPMGQTTSLTGSGLLSHLTTDYCGNGHIIYEKGFLTKTNKFVYNYYLRDHLGNNRSVITWEGSAYTNNHINVSQETNHYPFGMPYQSSFYGDSYQSEYQPYKFGGKELDAMYGLNWYDQGARPFDAIIPVTPMMDPLMAARK
jgi:hypothetical protein